MQPYRNSARRRGIAVVWVALMLIVLVGMVGLACDTALVYLTGQQLQNAADAAALAAVRHIRTDHDLLRAAAVTIAGANVAAQADVQLNLNEDNLVEGDIVLGRFSRGSGAFEATLDAPNAVKIVARRTADSPNGSLDLVFGSIFGVESANVSRQAIAMVGGGTGSGLITLNETQGCSLQLRGNVHLDVEGGDVQINSESNQALCAQGTAFTIEAPGINVHGDHDLRSNQGTFIVDDEVVAIDEVVQTDQPRENDPLAFLQPEFNDPPLPAPIQSLYDDIGTSEPDRGAIDTSGTYQPGYYSGGIDIPTGNVTLEPGVYVLGGDGGNGGMQINGGTFLAEGVMFYILGGPVDIGGNAAIHVTPLDDGSDYTGISIFQDRANHLDATIIGTGDLNLEGTLYFPNNHLNVGGDGAGFGNQLIADTIELHGGGGNSQANITINYQGPIPAVGNEFFLIQ